MTDLEAAQRFLALYGWADLLYDMLIFALIGVIFWLMAR